MRINTEIHNFCRYLGHLLHRYAGSLDSCSCLWSLERFKCLVGSSSEPQVEVLYVVALFWFNPGKSPKPLNPKPLKALKTSYSPRSGSLDMLHLKLRFSKVGKCTVPLKEGLYGGYIGIMEKKMETTIMSYTELRV